MPHVYVDSVLSPSELAKFPWDEETEMLEQTVDADLSGEVRLDRAVFSEWLRFGQKDHGRCPCAVALMRYAHRSARLGAARRGHGGHGMGAMLSDIVPARRCEISGHPRASPAYRLLARARPGPEDPVAIGHAPDHLQRYAGGTYRPREACGNGAR